MKRKIQIAVIAFTLSSLASLSQETYLSQMEQLAIQVMEAELKECTLRRDNDRKGIEILLTENQKLNALNVNLETENRNQSIILEHLQSSNKGLTSENTKLRSQVRILKLGKNLSLFVGIPVAVGAGVYFGRRVLP